MSLLFIISMYAEVTSYHPYELKLSSSQTINLQRSGKILEKNFPPVLIPPLDQRFLQVLPKVSLWLKFGAGGLEPHSALRINPGEKTDPGEQKPSPVSKQKLWF